MRRQGSYELDNINYKKKKKKRNKERNCEKKMVDILSSLHQAYQW